MDSKNRRSAPKSLNKSQSVNSTRQKKGASPAMRQSKKKIKLDNSNLVHSDLQKKPASQKLIKKKIQDLKTPDLIIKVSYKTKRISIPINSCDDKGLNQTVIPHIIRFEKEILKNSQFSPSCISNWKVVGHGDILKDYYFQTNKTLSVFKGQVLEIEPIWKQKIDNIKLKDFQIIKCIGTGGFSRVFLARLKANGAFYALKLMEKEGLLQSGKQCVVTNERDIMVGLNSPYVLNLEFAFETKHFVALALEYCPGGQLFYYLRKVRKMNQDQARYCFIEILLGIQYLHSKNIIYRDIKPENIMIDMDGNLKIADFGLSKHGIRANELAYTYCGSPQYMAPQMLSKSGHGFSVDYYCLGALLYELVTGNPPFYSRDVDKIYYAIQNEEIDFPTHVDLSPEIKMLLEGLLVKDPKRRLGSLGGVRQILGHPWVRKLKTTEVINKTVPTPVKINLFTYNINEEEIEEGEENFFEKFKDQDSNFEHMFEDFYFNRYCENNNVLDQALPSVKSDSTKQNKSLKTHYKSSGKQETIHKKIGGYKSSLSRQKNERFAIQINHIHEYPNSEAQRDKPKKDKLKKVRTKKQLDLIERSKKRDDKSIIKLSGNHAVQRLMSPKNSKKTGLKRIKSSTALLGTMKRPRY